MLKPCSIPGLFITGTDTGVGKTVIAGAIAAHLRLRGRRVAVCKPVTTGCVLRREGLVSQDAEFLAHHADADFPLDIICPQRYAEPLAPSVAAEREKKPLDWQAITRSLQLMSASSDMMIVEGVGGVLVPMDSRSTVLDMIQWLGLPAVIVARPGLGTINHTLLTISALKSAGAKIAGVVINQYPAENPSVAEEANPQQIEKWGKTPILCLVPACREKIEVTIPKDIMAAISLVDWESRVGK
jgi:dethiobiotin synthetase